MGTHTVWVNNELQAKLERFATLFQEQSLAELVRRKLDGPGNRAECQTSVKMGRKYANVDIGRSGRYMVELATGNIYGIKGYGQIHKGHQYGTLDTIDEWEWGGYTATRRAPATPKKAPWTMPAWMEKYRPHFSNTGGNSIEELMNDTSSNGANNLVRSALAIAVESQIILLSRLHDKGLLP